MIPTHKIPLGRHEVAEFVQEKTADGHGWVNVKVATVTGDVELQVNARALTRLAERALRTKRGRSSLAGGAMAFVVIRRERQACRQADVKLTEVARAANQ